MGHPEKLGVLRAAEPLAAQVGRERHEGEAVDQVDLQGDGGVRRGGRHRAGVQRDNLCFPLDSGGNRSGARLLSR